MVEISHMWLLSTLTVGSVTEKLIFKFYLILMNLNQYATYSYRPLYWTVQL